jgi:hypothetical protein
MKVRSLISVAFGLLLVSGCSTVGKSTGAGAGIGGIVGGSIGAFADPGPDGGNRVRNVLIGSAIGAGVGAAGGYFVGKKVDAARAEGKKEGEAQTREAASEGGDGVPKLIPAKFSVRRVPNATRGKTFVPEHFEYDIVEPAHWEIAQ